MSKKKYVSNEISKLHNVDEIENLVKSMKNYIANDHTGDDSVTDESAAFTENAFDLLNAVTYLMYQGGHKGQEIKENVELICKNTDKEIKGMVGDMITSQQSKNTH